MKKGYLVIAIGLITFLQSTGALGQNPGLLISEFLQNPSGTDSPYEYVELLATDDIDFSVTPYTIIVTNNGTAQAEGWVTGGTYTYAFEISTGTVSVGDVVYVGGTLMAPVGTKLRMIDTGVDGGDGGVGNATSSGVIGNGGANADGIGVFNVPVSSITSSTVPTDAVFFGTGIGAAEVNGGADGYELPVNDLYSGGKLTASSAYVVDADLTVASGMFDLTTNTFVIPRTFSSGTATETSEILFGNAAPVQIGFDENNRTVNEDAGTISFTMTPLNASSNLAQFDLEIVGFSTATDQSDFSIAQMSYTIQPGVTTPITVSVEILEDLLEEQSEYITLTIVNENNVQVSGNPSITLYITDNDRILPAATNEVKLQLLTSFSNGAEDLSSAEITAYDEGSSQLFIANSVANNIDFVDFQDPSNPVLDFSFNVDSIGAVNSITAYNGVVVVALENLDPQQNGYLLFLDADGNWLNRIEVGGMPDMVTFNHAKDKILVANEGEPNDDYTTDPEGSISIVDYSAGAAALTQSDVTMITFTAYNGQEATLRNQGIRIFGPGASASQDFEPEYITVLENDEVAYVSLQENNALAVLDLVNNTVEDILPLGTIDHSLFGFGMDVSNVTEGINIANFPVKGMFQPDAISSITIDGSSYIFTANEGDSRDYGGYSEEARIKNLVLDPTVFPDATFLQRDEVLGRLNTTLANGDADNNNQHEEIYTYGTRSFSIWDADGNLVFDSGDWFEQIIAADPVFAEMFNASNTGMSTKNRSDDKGPEPEGIETAYINGVPFAFVSLERIGGVMLFTISDPTAPQYLGYYNNRDVVTNGSDKGAEGLLYIEADASPNGKALLILSNEVSSSLTIFQVETCQELSGLTIATTDGTDEYCEGFSTEIVATSSSTLDYQWNLDHSEISGATESSLEADTPGAYSVSFTNTTESCSGTTAALDIEELPAPAPTITSSDDALTTEVFTGYEWYFEGSALPDSDQQTWTPTENGDYTVVVTGSNGCKGTSAVYTVMGLSLSDFENPTYTVAPNPANETVTISAQADFNVALYDAGGNLVHKSKSQNKGANIAVSGLSNGVYYIQITSETVSETFKLVVQH